MKKTLIILFLLTFAKGHCQFALFENYYFDSLESSYQMDYGISLCSIEGNFQKATNHLNSEYFKNNPGKAILLQSLLTHNLYGKRKAQEIIDGSILSDENKEFAKLWLSFHLKNTDEYKQKLIDFKKNYPTNYHYLKLKFRGHINYRDNGSSGIYKVKQQSLKSIDSLLSLKSLQEEDKIFFSLIKLDFLTKEELNLENDSKDTVITEEKAISELLALWKTNKSIFNVAHLAKMIDKCNSEICREAVAYLSNALNKSGNYTSSEKIFALLLNQNNSSDKMSIAELEKFISQIFTSEKGEQELHKARALIALFTTTKKFEYGFLIDDMLKPIPLSNALKQKILIQRSKESLVNDINSILNESEFRELRRNPEFKEKFRILQQTSSEDLTVVYGFMLFTSNFNKSLETLQENVYLKFGESPGYEEVNNLKKYIAFVERNPLFFEEFDLKNRYVQLKSEEEVFFLIDETKRLKEKFPGSSSVLNNCIFSLATNNKLISETQKQDYYTNYLQLVIDAFVIMPNKSLSNHKEDINYFAPILNFNTGRFDDYFGSFYKFLSEKTKTESKKYLKEKLEENPSQKNLVYFNYLFNKCEGGKGYFDSYIENLQINNSTEPLEYSFLHEIDSTHISNRAEETIQLFKANKQLSELNTVLPILYYIEEDQKAFETIRFILKNGDPRFYWNDEFSENFFYGFHQNNEDEFVIEKLTEIQKEFPNLEMNYLFITLLKLEKQELRNEGLEMLKNYSSQNFKLTYQFFAKYYYFKRNCKKYGFDEENIKLIFSEIGRKHPEFLKD